MESMFRILALSATCLLFAVGSAHAVCHDAAFKLERDKKVKNIDQILAYGQCVKAEQRARVGKWVCQVSSTAGMKVDEQRRVISDRISSANERFFVTITEVSDTEKRMRCDGSEYGLIDNLDGFDVKQVPDKLRRRILSFDGKVSRFDRHVQLSARTWEVYAVRHKPFLALSGRNRRVPCLAGSL